MKKKVSLILFICTLAFSLLLLFLDIECLNVYNLPDSLPMSYNDVENLNTNNVFGKNISASLEDKSINVYHEVIFYLPPFGQFINLRIYLIK